MSLVLPGAMPETVFPLVGSSPQGLAVVSTGLDVRTLMTAVVMHAFCVSGGVALSPPELIARRSVEIADATLAALRARASGPASPIAPPANGQD